MMVTRGFSFSAPLAMAAAVLAAALAFPGGHLAARAAAGWQTLETPHFSIHFRPEEEGAARELAKIAEEVHGRLVEFLRHVPRGKTEVVLKDSSDFGNGWVDPLLPFKNVTLEISYPLSSWASLGFTREDWLRYVFTHEYTHVLFFDTTSGLAEAGREVAGQVPLLSNPNLMAPAWYVEGLATYTESRFTRGGRVEDPVFDMYLRAAVLSGRLYTPDQLASTAYDLSGWPEGGLSVYLYGSSFVAYLAQKYGPEKLAQLNHASGDYQNLSFAATFRSVFQAGLEEEWQSWLEGLRRRYQEQKEKLEGQGLTQARRLTATGRWKGGLAVSPDGRQVAYTAGGRGWATGLRLLLLEEGKDRQVALSGVPEGSITWSPDGRFLYYTKPEYTGTDYLYRELYRYDLERGREERLTRGGRVLDAAWSPDGRRLALVTQKGGRTDLELVEPAEAGTAGRGAGCGGGSPGAAEEGGALGAGGGEPVQRRVLLEGGEELRFSSPAWSPDGRQLAVAAWRQGGRRDILLLRVEAGSQVEAAGGEGLATRRWLTDDAAVDLSPAWTPDGRYVLFSSGRSGIPNLYAVEVSTGRLFQVTNVLYGAFAPAPAPDGRSLVFLGYGPEGYDLYQMPLDPGQWLPVGPGKAGESEPPSAASPAGPPGGEVILGVHPYNPFPSLRPHWGLGYLQASERDMFLAFLTSGIDALQEQAYSLLLGYASGHGFIYDVTYQRLLGSGWRPLLTVSLEEWVPDALGAPAEVRRRQEVSLALPLQNSVFTAQVLTLGWTRRWVDADWRQAARAGWQLGAIRGRDRWLWYHRVNLDLLADDLTGVPERTAVLQWREDLTVAARREVGLRLLGGWSDEGGSSFALGGFRDDPGTEAYALRGFPKDSAKGERFWLGSLEYRPELWRVERGSTGPGLFTEAVQGILFVDAGAAWRGDGGAPPPLVGAGLEARVKTVAAYYLPLQLRLGVAWPVAGPGEGPRSYFDLVLVF
ncbi:MAG: hypothetical protein QJR13_00830 [Bacillota bacterium]|nr:hypothetical protein [Bacillota bacterium]